MAMVHHDGDHGNPPCFFCGSHHAAGVWHPGSGTQKEYFYVCYRCAVFDVLPKLVADAIMDTPGNHPHPDVYGHRERFLTALDRALLSASLRLHEHASEEEVGVRFELMPVPIDRKRPAS